MNQRNLFAYTAPGPSYPEYLSLNEIDGELVLDVRSQAPPTGNGQTARITLDPQHAREFGLALMQATKTYQF
jgi:hypothetical protein